LKFNKKTRRGRQFLRPISGDGIHFGSPRMFGSKIRSIVPWSRIFNHKEVLLAINTDYFQSKTAWVTIDNGLHAEGDALMCLRHGCKTGWDSSPCRGAQWQGRVADRTRCGICDLGVKSFLAEEEPDKNKSSSLFEVPRQPLFPEAEKRSPLSLKNPPFEGLCRFDPCLNMESDSVQHCKALIFPVLRISDLLKQKENVQRQHHGIRSAAWASGRRPKSVVPRKMLKMTEVNHRKRRIAP